MSRKFYTSDWHLNDEKVSRLRGFDSVEEHDDWIIDMANSRATKRDQIWICGDLNMAALPNALEKVSKVRAKSHLVWGNHDAGSPINFRGWNKQRQYLEVFQSVNTAVQHQHLGHEFLLSHFPYTGDHKPEDRHVQWRLRDEGLWLLHGHVHTAFAQRGKQINVGVDVRPKMLESLEVLEIIAEGPQDR